MKLKAHLLYSKYILRHKWFVFVAGMKINPFLFRRLLIHDWTKLTPGEWIAYTRYFYGNVPKHTTAYNESLNAFNQAWNHHQKANKHHWQFHYLTPDDGGSVPLKMPNTYIQEMVADWAGAGRAITGKWDVAAWYDKNKSKIILEASTRDSVEYLLTKHYNYIAKT